MAAAQRRGQDVEADIALLRVRLRRLGITDERFDRMTSDQLLLEILAQEVLAEQDADRASEAAWLSHAIGGAGRVHVKPLTMGDLEEPDV